MKDWEKEILDSVKIGDILRIATTTIKGPVVAMSDTLITIDSDKHGLLTFPFQCFAIVQREVGDE